MTEEQYPTRAEDPEIEPEDSEVEEPAIMGVAIDDEEEEDDGAIDEISIP